MGWESPLPIVVVVVVGLMVLSLTYSRSRANYDAATGELVLQYGLVLRAIAVFCSLPPFALLVGLVYAVAVANASPSDAFMILAAFVAFLALAVVLWLEVTRIRVVVSEEGIHGVSPWRAPRYIAWKDISEVTYSPLETCFVFKNRTGKPIKINLYLNGIRALSKMITTKLEPEIYRKAESGLRQALPKRTEPPCQGFDNR